MTTETMKSWEVAYHGSDETRYVDAADRSKARMKVARGLSDVMDMRDALRCIKSVRRVAKKPPTDSAEAFADAWNFRHPVGTAVHYWRCERRGEPSGTGPTRAPASVVGDRAVVWIAGCSGCVALSHVEIQR